MNVSVIIVTRGDVDLDQILEGPWPEPFKEIIIWDNSQREDLSVYGRYAAIAEAAGELIYVQDDDCIVSDPGELVSKWVGSASLTGPAPADGSDLSNVETRDHLVANMPPPFRHSFYREHCLVGFGAVFHRDLPFKAFERFSRAHDMTPIDQIERVDINRLLLRTCDIVFTALTPRVLVDVPYKNLPWADEVDRMYRQPSHISERQRMLDLVLKVRDAP